MSARQRRAWLRRREDVRDHIPADAMLCALVATETGYNTGAVQRILTGGSVRSDIDAKVKASCDEVEPLIKDFYFAGADSELRGEEP